MSAAGDADESVTSPDGWLRVDFRVEPGRMSHWIRSPSVVDTRSGKTLFSLFANWDGEPAWDAPGVVTLALRYYPEGGFTGIRVTIDATRRVARIDEGEWRPLEGLEEALEVQFDAKAKRARAGSPAAAPESRPRASRSQVAWIMGGTLVILAIVIGAGYLYEQQRQSKPPQVLIPVPKPTPSTPIPDYRKPENRGAKGS